MPSTVNPIPPNGAIRIDNYVSSFGTFHPETINPEAANIVLQRDPNNLPDPTNDMYWVNFHAYPINWYKNTINTTSGVGFAGAIENGSFNPADPAFQPGSYWLQNTNPGGSLSLLASNKSDAAQVLITRNKSIQEDLYKDGSSLFHSIRPVLAADFGAHLDLNQLIGAIQVENKALIKMVNPLSGSLIALTPEVTLTKFPVAAAAATASAKLASATVDASTPTLTSTSSSYAWMPITIPSDAKYLAMDFTFHNLSGADLLSVGINDSPLFQLESQYAIDGVAQSTGLLDISSWAGQNVELFLGLAAADDNNAGGTLTLGNISFISIPEPTVLAPLFLVALLAQRRRRFRV